MWLPVTIVELVNTNQMEDAKLVLKNVPLVYQLQYVHHVQVAITSTVTIVFVLLVN